MKNIYIYVGTGAYQAKDLENFFAVFDYDYQRITEFGLDKLTKDDIFIMPGGEIRAFLPAMKKAGIETIQKFINNGGIYIGICAGVYIAGKNYNGVGGLNLFSQILNRKKGLSVIDVFDNNKHKFQLLKENGPDLSEIQSDKILLRDKNGTPQAIEFGFAKGRVILFAAHPEGSVYNKLLPQEFSGSKYFKKLIDQIT